MTLQRGFSLIELLIVVAVIGIIAAIAVPSFSSSTAAANEANAIASMRTVISAQVLYNATTGTFGDATDLQNRGLIDGTLFSGTKNGYVFNIPLANHANFQLTAIPAVVGKTGYRGFFGDASGVIRYDSSGAIPTPTSPALGK